MCGLMRLYCYRNGVNWIEDYPLREAKNHYRRLIGEGVTVYHTVEV